LLFISIFFSCVPFSLAAKNFKTSYDVTYQINDTGITHVTFKTTLTNTSSQFYASSYKIKVGFLKITNVSASDQNGKINPTVIKTPDGETIAITFNKKVVGIKKTLPFTVSFDTKEVAQKQGHIWEVNIPGIANQKDFDEFTAHVLPPKSFDAPTYVKPNSGNGTDFTKDQLGKSGISMAFGNKQYYAFSLSYHLENTHLFPTTEQITLPPTTNYQHVVIDDINPKPQNVVQDADGNWIASYALTPSKKVSVVVKGRASVSLYPEKISLSSDEKKLYTQQQPYWESNEKLQALAKKLKTPEHIYAYVVNTLHYDFSRVTANSPRLGAAGVLQNPTSAVCLEFTDLFVALSRAANIPAREVDGFAYTQNSRQRPISLLKDILHAWPQYYDKEKQTWIMVDPTWGNTTGGTDYFNIMDFDHVAFVIKGQRSDYPIPPGGYKTKGFENAKDVSVSFADSFTVPIPTAKIKTTLSPTTIAGLPIRGTMQISVAHGGIFPSREIAIQSTSFFPAKQTVTSTAIPPFGFITIPFSFSGTSFLTNQTSTITIHIAQDRVSKNIRIVPFFLSVTGIVEGGVIFGITAVVLYIITTRARRLPFFR